MALCSAVHLTVSVYLCLPPPSVPFYLPFYLPPSLSTSLSTSLSPSLPPSLRSVQGRLDPVQPSFKFDKGGLGAPPPPAMAADKAQGREGVKAGSTRSKEEAAADAAARTRRLASLPWVGGALLLLLLSLPPDLLDLLLAVRPCASVPPQAGWGSGWAALRGSSPPLPLSMAWQRFPPLLPPIRSPGSAVGSPCQERQPSTAPSPLPCYPCLQCLIIRMFCPPPGVCALHCAALQSPQHQQLAAVGGGGGGEGQQGGQSRAAKRRASKKRRAEEDAARGQEQEMQRQFYREFLPENV